MESWRAKQSKTRRWREKENGGEYLSEPGIVPPSTRQPSLIKTNQTKDLHVFPLLSLLSTLLLLCCHCPPPYLPHFLQISACIYPSISRLKNGVRKQIEGERARHTPSFSLGFRPTLIHTHTSLTDWVCVILGDFRNQLVHYPPALHWSMTANVFSPSSLNEEWNPVVLRRRGLSSFFVQSIFVSLRSRVDGVHFNNAMHLQSAFHLQMLITKLFTMRATI